MQKLKIKNQNLGLTLLELLIAIGIVFILASIITSAIASFRKEALLQDTKAKILNELNIARSKTLASDEKQTWGVHFESTKIVRFRGPTYTPGDSSNTEVKFSEAVRISSILLGGPVDVNFIKLTGNTSASGTIVVELVSEPSRKATTTIYSSGVAE